MSDLLISIIVPVYNVPVQLLKRCIESLTKQTLQEIEIILVNDGSTDTSGMICDEYEKKDSRIHVVHKVNGGLSSARNAGVLHAKGKWITFVDGDDWIDTKMCSVMYKTGEKNDVQIVMCKMAENYKNSQIVQSCTLKENKVYSGEECKWLQKQVLVFDANISTSCAKLLRRDFIEENHILHDECLKQGAEDIEYGIRLFDAAKRAVFVNQAFYHYVYNDRSISTSYKQSNIDATVACFEQIGNFIRNKEEERHLMPYFYNRLLYVIITAAISGYFNPDNKEAYKSKKKKFSLYLEKPLIRKALEKAPRSGLSGQRKLILVLIQRKCFLGLAVLGKLRKKQKEKR